jgi:Kef-type K+ transport system membrane component KefB
VIGIIVLTVVIGFKKPDSDVGGVLFRTVAFFLLALVLGIIIYKLFKWYDARHPHTRRIPIMGIAIAFGLSYVADKYFGVADITGAYVAGVILCQLRDSEYITRKMDVNSYIIFGPVFFCSIGLQTNIRTLDMTILWFSLAFVAVGLLSKVIGCGFTARLLGYKGHNALKVGCGMMTRGEVALIVAQRGLKAEMLEPAYFTAVILLIIVSSILTPLLLKALYAKDPPEAQAAEQAQ